MRIKTTLLFTLITVNLLAQTIQLPLDPGRYAGSNSIVEASPGVYTYNSFVLPPTIFGGGKTSNLSSISLEDGVLWSKDYLFPKTTIPSKLIAYQGGYLLAGGIFDTNRNKHLMRLDANGEVIWSKLYGATNDVDTVNQIKSQAKPLADGNIILAGGAANIASDQGNNDLFLAKIDPNGAQIWSKRYCFSCNGNVESTFANVIETADGGFLLSGSVQTLGSTQLKLLLVKTDADGNLQWVRTYNNEPLGTFGVSNSGVQVLELPNGNLVLLGKQIQVFDNSGCTVVHLKPDGTLINAMRVRIAPAANYTLQVNQAYAKDNNALVIAAGSTQDTTPNLAIEQNLLFQVRLDGKMDWAYNYYNEILVGFGTAASDLVPVSGGGWAHLTNFSENFDNLYPILVVSDADGKTGCEQPVGLSVENNISLQVGNLTVQAQTTLAPLDYPVNVAPFNAPDFNLPTLDLGEDVLDCDSQAKVLNATVPGATAYAWNTGETDEQITVNETGIYAVTVTVADNCLQLIDSVAVQRADLGLEIQPDTSDFCEKKTAILKAVFTGVPDKIEWSTGAISDSIVVENSGLYIVTASNACASVADTFSLAACADTLRLFVPNVFTPNGDDVNDTFKAFGENFEVLTLQVYNRWGGLVFEANNAQPAWDGKVNGKEAPSEVYVYVIKYVASGQEYLKNGDLLLIR